MNSMPTRVVVADDEWLTAVALRTEMERQGYEVVGTAGTGAEALRVCREHAPDVVMMDVQMPEMDGLEATRALMQRAPTCVVIVTGQSRIEHEVEASGAMGYVLKPLLGAQIGPVVEAARVRFGQFLAMKCGATCFEDLMAKWLVVRHAIAVLARQGTSEEVGFELLRQRAADAGTSVSSAAEAVLAGLPAERQPQPVS